MISMTGTHMTFSILLNMLGGMIFGYEIIGMNSTLLNLFPCALHMDPSYESPWKLSLIIASVNFGGLIGSAVVPCASQRLHPCSMISLGCVFNICAFLGMVSPSFALHFVARLLTGVGVGVICTVCPAYVAEVSPPKYRGALSGLFQVSIALGILIASIVSHFVMGKERDMSASELYHTLSTSGNMCLVAVRRLQILLLLPLVLPFLLGAVVLWKNGTPRFGEPVHQGKTTVVLSSRKQDFCVDYSVLLSRLKWARKPLTITIMSAVALQLTGINAVMYYTFRFLDAIGIEKKSMGTIVVMFVNFSATCIALLLADRMGRRPLLIGGLAVMSFSMLAICLIDQIFTMGIISSALGIAVLSAYIYGFGIGPGFHFWVVCNEVLPSAISQEGFAIANIAQWLFLISVTSVFPVLEHLMGGFVFLLFASAGIMSALFFYFKLPETKGLRKQSIADLLCLSNE